MTLKTGNRLQKLRQQLTEKELDAILISQPENRYYLSGFDGSSGFLLITQQQTILATDFRYTEQAKLQAPDYRIFQTSGDIVDWFPELITGLDLKWLGFEGGHITLDLYQQLTRILGRIQPKPKLVPTDGLVESLRAIKDTEEIELIARAARITDEAMKYAENTIQVGISEKEAAWEVEKFLREQGSQPIPFDLIVASGPNSALPHAKPSQRLIQAGEPVVIDIGARVGGYSSDLSRTIYLDSRDDTFNKVYNTVIDAQLAAMNMIEEGMTGDKADSLARAVIEQAGFGKAFGHGLGHGVGLALHEQPRLGPKSTDKLASGMVFTIEPGIYLTGWGGVRIEDLVVMENGKAKAISKARKRV